MTRAIRLLPFLMLFVAACGEQRPAPVPEAPGAPAAEGLGAELGAAGHERGLPSAPITVVELSDFGCPYCARFALETYPELHREYVESGQVKWRYVPMVLGIFPNGDLAARAAECAAQQQRFWPMHDLLYERQREWKQTGAPEALFSGYARNLGLNERRFAACYRSPEAQRRVEQNTRVAAQLGVRATPSFLVNGHPVEGALPLPEFRNLLEMARTGQ